MNFGKQQQQRQLVQLQSQPRFFSTAAQQQQQPKKKSRFLLYSTLGLTITGAGVYALWTYNPDAMASLLRAMPWRPISRAYGSFASITLPTPMRSPVYELWGKVFGSDLTEIKANSLEDYPSLAEFFVRELKDSARPVDAKSNLVSPADSKVLSFGKAIEGRIEQIKGVTYKVSDFLGVDVKPSKETNEIYQIVLYLGPGDYHRFHSPAEWSVEKRRHFPGELLSVSPAVVRIIQGVFAYNERVVLLGNWEHGFFSMVAVGATNVGSIKLTFDDVVTNRADQPLDGTYYDRAYQNLGLYKGTEVGSFNMGSTIVLVFEAPKDFKFNVEEGQKLKYGQSLIQ